MCYPNMPTFSPRTQIISNAYILQEDLIQVQNLIQELERKARKIYEEENEKWYEYQHSHLRVVDHILHLMEYCKIKNDFKMRMKKDELIFFLQSLDSQEKELLKKWILENGGYSKLIFVPEGENLDSLFV